MVMLPSAQAELPLLQNMVTGKKGDLHAPPLSSPASEVGGIGMPLTQGPPPAELATLQGETSILWGSLELGSPTTGLCPLPMAVLLPAPSRVG